MVPRERKSVALEGNTRSVCDMVVGNHIATDAHRTGKALLGTVYEAVAYRGGIGTGF